ncbi:MAG: hypothetical protein KJN93_02435, partial [Alphaproteobacteria bacterium]|nr:hypothetical protein [Alphaproteobacteria bacterium]
LKPLGDAEFEATLGAEARDPSNNLIGHFTDSAYLQLMAGDRRGALHTAAAAFRYARSGTKTLKPLIYALAPKPLARAIRSRGAASL